MNLVVSLGHSCNLRCSYCYAGRKDDRTITPDTMRKALDLAFAHPSPVVRVAPFGGEPLLHPRLLETLALEARKRADATNRTLHLGLTTNGTLLHGERLDLLARHGFQVTVSLDGDQPAHDSARVFADDRSSWESTVAGLKRAQERLGQGRTVSVVHPGNVDRLAESFDFITSLGVSQLSFNPDFDAAWDDDALARLEHALERLADRAIEHYRAGYDFTVQPFHARIISHLKGGYSPGDRCAFGCGELAVAPSGRLYPCDRLIGEDGPEQRDVVIGDVERGIDTERVDELRRAKDRPRPDCAGCAVIDRCMWWCGCVSRALTGRVDGVSDLLCRVEQASIRAADRLAGTLFDEGNPAFLGRYYIAAAGAKGNPGRD